MCNGSFPINSKRYSGGRICRRCYDTYRWVPFLLKKTFFFEYYRKYRDIKVEPCSLDCTIIEDDRRRCHSCFITKFRRLWDQLPSKPVVEIDETNDKCPVCKCSLQVRRRSSCFGVLACRNCADFFKRKYQRSGWTKLEKIRKNWKHLFLIEHY